MDKSEYLHTLRSAPRAFPKAAGWVPPDPGWIAEAWALPEVQSTVAADLVDEVRKWPPEPFLHDSMAEVRVLARVLNAEQVVRLYSAFRERWPVCEPQLREEFAWAFPGRTNDLPPPFCFREILKRLSGDPEAAVSLMEHYPQHPALPEGASIQGAKSAQLAMRWVARMVEVGWFPDREEYDGLLGALREGNDLVVEEGAIEWLGEPSQIRVRFRDEETVCLPALLIPALEVFGDRQFGEAHP